MNSPEKRPRLVADPTMARAPSKGTSCREILIEDLPGVVDCLTRGFPERPRHFWRIGLERLARWDNAPGYPRFGHALVHDGMIVGVLLQIHSVRDTPAGVAVFCNLSSWCVDPEYRGYAILLHAKAVARKEVTYLNISPAPHTRPTIERLGFRRYAAGQFVFLPLLSRPRADISVEAFDISTATASSLPSSERRLLVDHVERGCLAVLAINDGMAFPFVFQRRSFKNGLLPYLYLIYCRDVAALPTFAHALGRHFLFRGPSICVVDANGPAPGLTGRFFPGRHEKYADGPTPARLADLAYSELVIFDL